MSKTVPFKKFPEHDLEVTDTLTKKGKKKAERKEGREERRD